MKKTNNKDVERILKLINKHPNQTITLETREGQQLNTIYYGTCEYDNSYDIERLIFKVEGRLITSVDLKNVEYDLMNHTLVLK